MIYDLLVVGNGIAAQTFLHELFNCVSLDVKISQNFSIAQVYSEDLAPSCSIRSSAAVSLNGIEEGISPLGNTLREAFLNFETFVDIYNPTGVEKVRQIVSFTNDLDEEKMRRRFKNISLVNSSLFKGQRYGVELDSYLISPESYRHWFDKQIDIRGVVRIHDFLKSIHQESGEFYSCHCLTQTIKARKIIFCSGAYAKIFSDFFPSTDVLGPTSVVSGAFLYKKADLKRPSFYLTLDGHNLIYRSVDKSLSIGSASMKGNIVVADLSSLKKMHELFCENLSISIDKFDTFKVVNGLRHKGKKRVPMATFLNEHKTQYMLNGYYKNGYSYAQYFAKKALGDLFSH